MRERLSSGRAVLALAILTVALGVAGCTSTPAATDTTQATPVDQATTTAATDPTSPTTTSPLNALEYLTAALDQYGAGYQFEAVATVGDESAAVITGFVIGKSAEMHVVSGDGSVTYVITPTEAWIRVDDGDWDPIDSSGPVSPPLDALAAPDSITITATDGNGVTAIGIYRGDDFDSDEPVGLTLKFVDGFLVSASYTIGSAAVSTTFAPLTDEAITIPIP